MSDLTPFSVQYAETTPLKHRQDLGQFFTIKSLRELAVECLPKIIGAEIAELSCGSGEFVDTILEHFPQCHIDAVEVDPPLYDHCVGKYAGKNVTVFNQDALTFSPKKKYKFVIGNPPYFEYDPADDVAKEYEDVIGGRPNIYALFIKKGIDLLEPGGYLSFVIPTSMLNGSYFAPLRQYIITKCSIVKMIVKDDDHFDGALQNVMIFVLRKERNNGNYVFYRNGITIFTTKKDELSKLFDGSSYLMELGFGVKTGTVVWNQHKEKLSQDPQDVSLIWSHNIENEKTLEKKPQYIKWDKDVETKPVIAVNRVTGSGENAVIKACLINKPRFVCENHVNVIFQREKTPISIEQLLPHIRNKRALDAMRMITGNTQISKTELEMLFPIWGVNPIDPFE